MPKVTWRTISPELRKEDWIKEFNEAIESRRRKNKPSYVEIADAAQISRQALAYKLKSGNFTLEEFSGIVSFMKFPDELVLKLVKKRI